FSVDITGAVGGDITTAANSITLRSAAPVAGNARLAGATVTIATPVAGSVLVSAQSLILEGAISGDVSFFGETITFAPGAKVDGTLSIQAPKEIAVPASVVSADRVKFTQLVAPDYMSEAGKTAETVVKRFWPQFWIAAFGLLLLFLIGAAMIALTPKAIARMQMVSETRPFRNLGLGVLAFASVLGLVPVVAMTLVGILLLPFVFLFIALACGLAYVAGTYLVGLRISRAFLSIDSNLKRLGVLAVALIVAVLVGMMPFVGWFVTLALLIFGLGTFAVVAMVRWSAKDAAKLQYPTAGAAVATPPSP
ncbi:MAG: bactofilin family protein, partial [Devosia sp.]